MSITNGLSSNNTRSQQNPLQLDANTRAGIQAQNQARLLQSIGVIKNDEFVGGGGLNPLKNLYSAAAASFLKNKRGGDAQPGVKKPGQAQEQSANALSTLAASSASSPSISFQQKNARVGGPASGANYKKYAWDGKPGPTGSDNTVEPTPADDPADPVDPSGQPADPGPAAPADFTKVISSFKKVVEDADGGFADNNDGSYQFKVMDIRGDMKQDGNLLVGSVSADSGTYTFTIQADGSVKLDASKGNTASAEFDQLKRLLDGNLSGARRVQTDPPAEPAPPADSGGTGGTGDTGGTGGTGAAAATPPPPVDTEADDSLVGA
ncbi:MAG: hypothetical protein K2Q09_03705, partial [Phycisphaerales bacterium]|nr:hypothetical protein [Phycisphaerales bacterium]